MTFLLLWEEKKCKQTMVSRKPENQRYNCDPDEVTRLNKGNL